MEMKNMEIAQNSSTQKPVVLCPPTVPTPLKWEGLTFKRERVPLSKGIQIQRIQTENTNKNIKKERKKERNSF